MEHVVEVFQLRRGQVIMPNRMHDSLDSSRSGNSKLVQRQAQ